MPRDGGWKGRGRPTTTRKKIVIRPYQKPPALPPQYYEQTVQELLQGTLQVLTPGNKVPAISYQNAYTAVIHLVSHQYGPRLYQDLEQSLQHPWIFVCFLACIEEMFDNFLC